MTASVDGRCGRPRTPPAIGFCKNHRPMHAPACLWHMTDEEHSEYVALRDQFMADMVALEGPDDGPACWSWPVTEADLRSVEKHGLVGMLIWQNERCGMCGRDLTDDRELDHDHNTGLVRGYLCMTCNRTEPSGTRQMYVGWRARPAAAMLGLTERYYSPWAGGYAEPKRTEPPLDRHPAHAFAAWLNEDEPEDAACKMTVVVTIDPKSPRWIGHLPKYIHEVLAEQMRSAFTFGDDDGVLSFTAIQKDGSS